MPDAAYKESPLWSDAIALAQEAYRIADRARADSPALARHLRKAAVAVPSHVAGALTGSDEAAAESLRMARGALAEVERQAGRLRNGLETAADGLTARARRLEDRISELARRPNTRPAGAAL
jgi:four helix bundle protein